jgi:hypothetical protein
MNFLSLKNFRRELHIKKTVDITIKVVMEEAVVATTNLESTKRISKKVLADLMIEVKLLRILLSARRQMTSVKNSKNRAKR